MRKTRLTAYNQYALEVQSGKIPACERLKQAVNRYFNDLNNPLYAFDSATVERFIAFSHLCPHVKGPLRGQPIELEPWQQFAFACLLGFKVAATGRRKYRSAYIQVPRKNAKSTVAAILANWFLVMEPGQQDIYTAAVSRDQARIVFDDARQMNLISKPLRKRLTIQQHKMIYAKTNSLLKPLASKASTIEGTNPSLAVVDEYHLHPDNAVYSALELGMGARPEGILFAITTAGSNVVSACKQHYDYCCQILAGEEQNESLFALIYELDDESEVEQPEHWIKANPNLGVSVDVTALTDTINKARGIPSQWVEMLTKRFNIWCQGETPWMGAGAWDACKADYSEDDLAGLECYAGLDLSSTSDITSVCYSFPVENCVLLLTRHYIPEAQLNNAANKNRAIYRQWVKSGWIRPTPGDCIDYDRIRDDVLADSQRFNIKLTGFDTWNATHLRTQLQGAGLDVEPFPQTYMKFSPVAKSAEVFVNRKVIQHNGDPVLAWAMSNVVMETDANANIKPNKKKAANKIDPAIAFLMSFGTYQIEHEDFAYTLSEEQQQRLKIFNGI
ncbi:Phage terminase-like protein%2C large subunit [Yersinia aleksiciae]|nr:Phage terminase-like protein%2C large subunit [Yersinia aleksiciae]